MSVLVRALPLRRPVDEVRAFSAALTLTGINPAEQPLGPPTTQVFAWVDDQRASIKLS